MDKLLEDCELAAIENIIAGNNYHRITKGIKRKCEYYDIINRDEMYYVCYRCSKSKLKGVIGFGISENTEFISHIIP